MAREQWRFYVYELRYADGALAYVGKGSGRRLAAQQATFNLEGEEVCRFRRERDAYAFERARIAELKPALNRHPGGNGSRGPAARRKYQWERDIERVGSRRYVARYLIANCAHLVDPSKLDAIRRVADGPRA